MKKIIRTLTMVLVVLMMVLSVSADDLQEWNEYLVERRAERASEETVQQSEDISWEEFKAQRKAEEAAQQEASTRDWDALVAKYEAEKAYEEAYDDGYDDGIERGKRNGYTEGYSIGYLDGEDEGYEVGYQEGKDAGLDTGYSEGYAEAKKEDRIVLLIVAAIAIIIIVLLSVLLLKSADGAKAAKVKNMLRLVAGFVLGTAGYAVGFVVVGLLFDLTNLIVILPFVVDLHEASLTASALGANGLALAIFCAIDRSYYHRIAFSIWLIVLAALYLVLCLLGRDWDLLWYSIASIGLNGFMIYGAIKEIKEGRELEVKESDIQ